MPRQQKGRKRKGKDLDEIFDDLKPEKYQKLTTNVPLDEDLPGQGQFYCVECVRHFIDQASLEKHKATKQHRKRAKELKQKPYSVHESEAAGGLGSFEEYENLTKINKLKKQPKFDSGTVCS